MNNRSEEMWNVRHDNSEDARDECPRWTQLGRVRTTPSRLIIMQDAHLLTWRTGRRHNNFEVVTTDRVSYWKPDKSDDPHILHKNWGGDNVQFEKRGVFKSILHGLDGFPTPQSRQFIRRRRPITSSDGWLHRLKMDNTFYICLGHIHFIPSQFYTKGPLTLSS